MPEIGKNNVKCAQLGQLLLELRDLRDQMKVSLKKALHVNDFSAPEVLKKMAKMKMEEVRGLLPAMSVVEKLTMRKLKQDYEDALDTLNWYGVMDGQDGKSYRGDFAYRDDKGREVIIDGEFTVPAWSKISAKLKKDPKKLARIKSMVDSGNEPKLFLVPIGKKLSSLVEAVMAKEDQLNYRYDTIGMDTDILVEKAGQHKLLPHEIFIVPANNFTVSQIDARPKQDVIKRHHGWLVVIAETKEEIDGLEGVASKQEIEDMKSPWNDKTPARQVDSYSSALRDSGMTGLLLEDYIVMMMDAEKHGRKMDKEGSTFLIETFLPECKIAIGRGNYPVSPAIDPNDKSRGFSLNAVVQQQKLRLGRRLNLRRAVRVEL